MNDMRLPGLLGVTNTESLPGAANADARPDPARDFDAVMSRYQSQPARERAPDGRIAGARQRADEPGKTAAKAEKADARNDGGAAATGPDGAAPSGRPVARAPAEYEADGEESVPQVEDATTLVAVVIEAAQVAATTVSAGSSDTPQACDEPTDAKAGAERLAGKAARLPLAPTQARAGKQTGDGEAESLAEGGDDTRTPLPEVDSAARPARPARQTARNGADPAIRPETASARAQAAGVPEGTQRALALAEAVAATPQHAKATAPIAPAADAQGLVAAAPVSSTTATYSIAHASIPTTVGTPGFVADLAQRLVVFASHKVQRAEIALSPAELGPLAVAIEVRGHEATLAFNAAHGATRAALEEALPRLREMLAAQGLHLAGAHVGGEARRDSYRSGRGAFAAAGGAGPVDEAGGVDSSPGARRRTLGLIDVVV